MSIKHFVITTLVANLLPSTIAIGSAAGDEKSDGDESSLMMTPHFPKMQSADLVTDKNGVSCYYDNDVTGQNSTESFTFKLERGKPPQTDDIICPAKPGRKMYWIKMSPERETLHKYHINFPVLDYGVGSKLYDFRDPPPAGTGLDPLRDISDSHYREELQRVDLAAKKLESHPQWLNVSTNFFGKRTWIFAGGLFTLGKPGMAAIAKMRTACGAAMRVVMTEYGSFANLCDAYRRMSEEAVEKADDLQWTFLKKWDGYTEILAVDRKENTIKDDTEFVAEMEKTVKEWSKLVCK
ncbi:hypothetical protein FOZ62_009258 [Perkinsus olseni]|uniref:Uncharacterized protein n=1 Tax=Perkinsus olseni TaxID=32597 RepID=A0A7J6ND83_PEROL|nr:hypothetical protein FOZ62_009258 [Perkinsus olseni]